MDENEAADEKNEVEDDDEALVKDETVDEHGDADD